LINKKFSRRAGPLAFILLLAATGFASQSLKSQRWARISNDGRPWVIYYWVNGLMDREGITRDIASMADAGIGGMLVMDVNLGLPDDGPEFNSPEWRDLLSHAADEAKKNGLVFALQPAAGWSGMGGPWVSVEDSIKELTWSVTPVRGSGKQQLVSLSQPQSNSSFYRDIAVLAVPGRGAENVAGQVVLLPSSTLSPQDFEKLRDGAWDKDILLPTRSRIDVELPEKSIPGALRFRLPRLNYDQAGELKVHFSTSPDGDEWQSLKSCSLRWNLSAPEVRSHPIQNSITVTLPPGTTRFLRLQTDFNSAVPLAELEFLAGAHIDRREAKAALIMDRNHDCGIDEINCPTEATASGPIAPLTSVVNLSSSMDAAGNLTWDVPDGDWRILRFGYTTTGRQKGVVRAGGGGRIVDMIDPAALERHLEAFYGPLIETGGLLDDGRLQVLHCDSWEEFHLNWTAGFAGQFEALRGYDLIPYLPVLAGETIIQSTEVSERFLWDFRRTIADLMVENYFNTLSRWGEDHGLVTQSDHAGRQQWLSDPVRFQSATDIPIGEFWLFQNELRPDVNAAASAAHVTGKNLALAEAFTDKGSNDGWHTCPSRMKSLGDRAFCGGINCFNFHTYTAQPSGMPPPGVTLGKWGTMLSRHRLWWKEFAPEWHGYIRRCSELLREGRFCADVLLIPGDGAPSETGSAEDFPVPSGYGFDLGDSALLEQAVVENGEVVLPSGMHYQLLSLLSTEQRPATLRQLKRLVDAGATVHGPRPMRAPGLKNYPASDDEVSAFAEELWPAAGKTLRKTGWGRLFSGMPIGAVLDEMNLPPQFESDQGELHFICRETASGPLVFVANPTETILDATCRFRVTGRTPVLYDPVSDQTLPIPVYSETENGITTIPLRFDALDSVFIRFVEGSSDSTVTEIQRDGVPFSYFHPVSARSRPGPLRISGQTNGWVFAQADGADYRVKLADSSVAGVKQQVVIQPIAGPWSLSFSSPIGDEPDSRNDALPGDWSKSQDDAVKYFSGTGTYRTVFEAGSGRTVLDLGTVYDQAIVRVNGKLAGTLWKAPFRLDISRLTRPGSNTLDVEVTNAWRNRLIGEERAPADLDFNKGSLSSNPLPEWVLNPGIPRPEPSRKTFTTYQHLQKNSPLSPSGLVGPVQLEHRVSK
jgi:hypothetical protein